MKRGVRHLEIYDVEEKTKNLKHLLRLETKPMGGNYKVGRFELKTSYYNGFSDVLLSVLFLVEGKNSPHHKVARSSMSGSS